MVWALRDESCEGLCVCIRKQFTRLLCSAVVLQHQSTYDRCIGTSAGVALAPFKWCRRRQGRKGQGG